MVIEFQTEDKLEYSFLPNGSGAVQFRIRAPNDAHVALTTGASESDPMYEVILGGWGNTKSVIRKNRSKPDVAESPTPGILNPNEYRGFWIRWSGGNIEVGREGDRPFMSFQDNEHIPISYVGVCTAWGSTGAWMIQENEGDLGPAPAAPAAFRAGACWVGSRGGQVPPSAFVGGEDNGEPLYVARAGFGGGLIPGKLVPSHGTAYIPWGGQENAAAEYDILCDFNGTWQACNGGNIPSNALTGGQSEDGEPLYIGRTVHDGCLTIGKVQPSHGCLYIPYGGQEMSFPEYEILVQ